MGLSQTMNIDGHGSKGIHYIYAESEIPFLTIKCQRYQSHRRVSVVIRRRLLEAKLVCEFDFRELVYPRECPVRPTGFANKNILPE